MWQSERRHGCKRNTLSMTTCAHLPCSKNCWQPTRTHPPTGQRPLQCRHYQRPRGRSSCQHQCKRAAGMCSTEWRHERRKLYITQPTLTWHVDRMAGSLLASTGTPTSVSASSSMSPASASSMAASTETRGSRVSSRARVTAAASAMSGAPPSARTTQSTCRCQHASPLMMPSDA